MGNDESRPALHQADERGIQLRLCNGIESGHWFIENQDGRVAQNRACQGDALPLAPRKVDSTFAHKRIVAMRQLHDETMGLGSLRCRDDLLKARLGFAVGDVFSNGSAKEDGLLEDHAHLPPKGFQLEAADVLAVDQDPAPPGIKEPQQQIHDGRFACTAEAHQRHGLARFSREGKVL